MLQCLKCQAKITLDADTCAACGTKIDADGNGVPDALEKMVEDKARALLASEKQREVNDKAQAQRDEEAAAKVLQRKAEERQLEFLERRQEKDESTPPRAWRFSKGWAIFYALIALVVGGIIFPACVEPLSGSSFVAAKVFCPSVCPTCRGPGRIWTWHESGGSYEGNVSRQLCHNDVVDIDKISWGDSDDEKFAPYRLTLWASVPFDWALIFILLCVVGPFVVARRENKSRLKAIAERTPQIADLERRLGVTSGSSNEPYR